ncbi:MAG: hypothetical protein Q8867_02455 [Bacteroidota bacterium]|nr:hypothetical protein [Bacteroidota bacterium]
MVIFVNNQEIRIFEGAKVRDAVLAYSREIYSALIKGKIRIVDRFGNNTDPDGTLSPNQSIFIIPKTESL